MAKAKNPNRLAKAIRNSNMIGAGQKKSVEQILKDGPKKNINEKVIEIKAKGPQKDK
jgi:hypothetical protein